MTVHYNGATFTGKARSLESWREKMHHLKLLVQFWWNYNDAEQYVHIDDVRYKLTAPPRVSRRNWVILKDGAEQRVVSQSIQQVSGSINGGLGK